MVKSTILDFQTEWFYSFLIYKSPPYLLPNFESIGLSVQENKFKTDFQSGGYGGHLRLLKQFCYIFNLQVALIPPTKFPVEWPFNSKEEVQNRFSRWWLSWISDQNYFSYFWSTGSLDTSYQVSSQVAFPCSSRNSKQIFKMAAHAAILEHQSEWF